MIKKIGLFFLIPFFVLVLSILISENTGLNEFLVIGLVVPVGLILFFANKNKILSYLNSDVFWTRSHKKNGIETTEYFSFNPFSPSPKMCEISYKDGKIDGTRTQWYKNGQKQQECNFKDDKEEGKLTTWYENGQKQREFNHKDGKQDGKFTSWYENGQKELEYNFKEGKEDGIFTGWHLNGQKSGEGIFKEGKQDSKWTEWDRTGQIIVQENYKDGKKI